MLRHINKGATVEGVYTVSRWEYPVKAIREAIRNAVVHRDYSLTGKDVKVAIYDDMVEITSPGLLPPSIDYAAMESRQSDARNKVIAPIFKRLGIIDQWGNGLKLIADELKEYPNIKLRWKEIGLSFQVQFVNMNINSNTGTHLGIDVGNVGIDVGNVGIDVSVGTSNNEILLIELIRQNSKITVKEIADTLKLSKRQCERIIADLKHRGILSRKGTNRTGYWTIAGLKGSLSLIHQGLFIKVRKEMPRQVIEMQFTFLLDGAFYHFILLFQNYSLFFCVTSMPCGHTAGDICT